MGETIVSWFGKGDGGHECGYCKSEDTNISSGMWAHCMSCQTYENLLNHGWRRSGQYCYKPAMNETCCPQYTIKCDVTQFKLSKSQKKVLKMVNKFLVSGHVSNANQENLSVADTKKVKMQPNTSNDSKNDLILDSQVGIDSNLESGSSIPHSDEVVEKDLDVMKKSKVLGADPNKPKCRKAKEIRREKNLLKSKSKTGESTSQQPDTQSKFKNEGKSIENFIEELPADLKHKLEFSLVCVANKETFEATFDVEFALYRKYQTVVHGDSFDELSEAQFRRFLVDGPLHFVPPSDDKRIPSTGLGAFHQQYFLDGKLIAVGVIDILPHCVSSKYFFYDPDYRFLSLGTYSALREIYFIRSLQKTCPELKYYYMGYYIDTCPKMKYKGNYSPSFLLCPETYSWHPVAKCIPKFSVSKYSRLNEDKTHKAPSTPDINSALILNNQNIKTFNKFVKKLSTKERLKQAAEIKEYVQLVGSLCNNILLHRP